MNELVITENLNAVEVFTAGGVDSILAAIREEVINDIPDVSTEQGRKDIASRAHKVAQSKTAIDKLGKDLADKLNAQLKPINAERKKSKDTLDALKNEVRKPLTDYEDAEKERIELIKARCEDFVELSNLITSNSSETQANLDKVTRISIGESFDEYEDYANDMKSNAIRFLSEKIADQQKAEAEKAELHKFRKEAEERAKKDRDDQIARDAAAKAEAEKKAAIEKADREIKEATEREKKLRQETLENIKQAGLKAAADKQAALKAASDKIAAEKKAEDDATAKREANTKHKGKINREALAAIMKLQIDEVLGKKILTAIVRGRIPNIKIQY